MNYRSVAYLMGQILRAVGLLLLIPLLVAFIFKERDTYTGFIIPAGLMILLGSPAVRFIPKNKGLGAKEGFVCVALAWIVVSAGGALPFVISGAIPNFIDAFFETVSGFTTTGSTILTEISSLPKGILFWRSFTHWIGGMGILVFVLMLLPKTDARSMRLMHIMRAEMPGPTVGKIVPKVRQTAMILYAIYFALSAVETVILRVSGMNFYDALIHTFSTAGTGGFNNYNDSIASQPPHIQYILAVFMLLFSINFNLYYLILMRHIKDALRSEEMHMFFVIVGLVTGLIAWNLHETYDTVEECFRAAFFQVSSVISTTGFVSHDFDTWPVFSQALLVLLMFIGACAGSTGGGIKVGRILILLKSSVRDIRTVASPRRVKIIRSEGRPVEEETVRNASAYMIIYTFMLALSVVILTAIDERDLVTTFTAVVTCLNNVGPGLGKICGATGNFSSFSSVSKLILTSCMLAGRLEIFPMLLLILPSTWKKS